MADVAITNLSTELTTPADDDLLAIDDISASETKKIEVSNLLGGATQAEMDHVHGVTSDIQTQLNAKAASSHNHTESDITDLDHDAAKIQGVDVDDTDIADGKVLKFNATSGDLEYETPGGGGISDIVEDTTPQLGGDLDCNSHGINMGDQVLDQPKIRDYGESVNALGDLGGGTDAINLELGNVVTATVSTGAQTFTFTNPPASGTAGSFTLILTNGGSQTVTWPASVNWGGSEAPTLTASGIDILTFITVDGGTTWYGFLADSDMGVPT